MRSSIKYAYLKIALVLFVLPNFYGKNLYAQDLFDADVMHTISVTIEMPHWYDTLQVYYNAGLAGQEKKDLPATVDIDGNMLKSPVAIRFKGHYSNFGFPGKKKPFRINVGKYDDDQKYNKIKKFNLHNFAGDPSFLREYIAYGFLNHLGIAASRTSYTRLYINKEYFGCYLIVEEPEDNTFLKNNFDTKNGNLFEADESTDLSWQGYNATDYPEMKLQTDESDSAWGKLISWIDLFNNYHAIDFSQRLNEIFETEYFLCILAADVLMDNWDSYAGNSRNFFIYDNDLTHKLTWIPWDYNLAFWYKDMDLFPKRSNGKMRPLIWRIADNAYLKEKYYTTICNMLNEDVKTYDVDKMATRMYNLIKTAVEEDTLKFYSNEDFYQNMTGDVTVNMLRNEKPTDVTLPSPVAYFHKRADQMRQKLLADDCNCTTTHLPDTTLFATIYPNPVENAINIYSPNELATVGVYIKNIQGQIISKQTATINDGFATVSAIDLSSGIYFVTVENSTQHQTIKIVKK